MTVETVAGPFALVAALATVIGAVTLGLFFTKGQPWGTINDISSIVLMLATVPVALAIANVSWFEWAAGVAAVGVIGMIGVSVTQGLLVARRFTYERLLPWTLGFGAVVGAWYLLLGLGGIRSPFFDDGGLRELAIASGAGFIALDYGFLRGSERHLLSIIGGLVLLVASTWFLAWLGGLFITGDIYAV